MVFCSLNLLVIVRSLEVRSISPLPYQTLPMQFMQLVNSMLTLLQFIELQLFKFYATCKLLPIVPFFYQQVAQKLYKVFLTLLGLVMSMTVDQPIGLVMSMTVDQPLDSPYFLAVLSYPSKARNRKLFLTQPQKQNMNLLLTTTSEIVWLYWLLTCSTIQEFQLQHELLFIVNIAIKIAYNNLFCKSTKHIEIYCVLCVSVCEDKLNGLPQPNPVDHESTGPVKDWIISFLIVHIIVSFFNWQTRLESL